MVSPAVFAFWLPFLTSCMSLLHHGFIVCTSNELCVEAAGLRRNSSPHVAWTHCLEHSLSSYSQDGMLYLISLPVGFLISDSFSLILNVF